jgi:hypothetical protein
LNFFISIRFQSGHINAAMAGQNLNYPMMRIS